MERGGRGGRGLGGGWAGDMELWAVVLLVAPQQGYMRGGTAGRSSTALHLSARACARARACVRAPLRARVHACVQMRAEASSRARARARALRTMRRRRCGRRTGPRGPCTTACPATPARCTASTSAHTRTPSSRAHAVPTRARTYTDTDTDTDVCAVDLRGAGGFVGPVPPHRRGVRQHRLSPAMGTQ
jgi:hypothetical protein